MTKIYRGGFMTMDSNREYRQNLAILPNAVRVIEARSNRIEHLQPLVASIFRELNHLQPKTLRNVVG